MPVHDEGELHDYFISKYKKYAIPHHFGPALLVS